MRIAMARQERAVAESDMMSWRAKVAAQKFEPDDNADRKKQHDGATVLKSDCKVKPEAGTASGFAELLPR